MERTEVEFNLLEENNSFPFFNLRKIYLYLRLLHFSKHISCANFQNYCVVTNIRR